ncbi:MAG TPA: GAF domain-containing protein [Elusimicrobiales bacterium]|nr:GAF domain-containing protein [Elusimicrobiales bacterium]
MLINQQQYNQLFTVFEKALQLNDCKKISELAIKEFCEGLHAEAGTIFMYSADRQEFLPMAVAGVEPGSLSRIKFKASEGVIGWVAQKNQPMKVDNTQTDPRFANAADSVTGFSTRSIVAAPIPGKNGALGVLELLNKQSGPFTIGDMETVNVLGLFLGVVFAAAASKK